MKAQQRVTTYTISVGKRYNNEVNYWARSSW